MRRKRKGRGDVIIDLTSLLDVIFIVLLVVVCAQVGLSAGTSESLAELESIKAETEASGDLYRDMLSTSDALNELVFTASITVPYDKDNLTRRKVKVLVEGQEIKAFSLFGNDTRETFREFKNYLKEYAFVHPDSPVILSLNEDDDKILYRDEISVKAILEELMEECDNVYIKGRIKED